MNCTPPSPTYSPHLPPTHRSVFSMTNPNMIRQVTREKTLKTTTVTAPWGSASKGSKAHIAAAGGDSRHPMVLFNYSTYWWYFFQKVFFLSTIYAQLMVKVVMQRSLIRCLMQLPARLQKKALHPLLYWLMYSWIPWQIHPKLLARYVLIIHH